jgi:hypothetical protein
MSLTEQQREGKSERRFDLATGYPLFPLSGELIELVAHWTKFSLLQGAQAEQLQDPFLVHESLNLEAVGTLLDVPSHISERFRVTFSGSIALDRAIEAIWKIAANNGKGRLSVVTSDPSIDITRDMFAERFEVDFTVVEQFCNAKSNELDVDRFVSTIRKIAAMKKSSQIVVSIESPVNPTGAFWSSEDLLLIAEETARADGIILADHCFLIAGIQRPNLIPSVFHLPPGACRWIAIWDTGKTFDVGGDKLAFIGCSDDEVATAVDAALYVIQYAASKRSFAVFSQLFRHPNILGYVDGLGKACRVNLDTLARCAGPHIEISAPRSGTFAWLNVRQSGLDGADVRSKWLNSGVATVSGNTFYFDLPERDEYVRIALARTEGYFGEAMHQLFG